MQEKLARKHTIAEDVDTADTGFNDLSSVEFVSFKGYLFSITLDFVPSMVQFLLNTNLSHPPAWTILQSHQFETMM